MVPGRRSDGLRRVRRSIRRIAGRGRVPPRPPRGPAHHVPAPDERASRPRRRERRRLRHRRLPRRRACARHPCRPRVPRRRSPPAWHQPVPRSGDEPHRRRAPVGDGCTNRIAGASRSLSRLHRSRAARPVRADAARGVPRDRARQLHVGRPTGRLGVDHVPHVPVGPELREPRRLRRHAPGDARPRQPGGRRAPARRHRVHLEADRHQLPEPAGGAPDRPGPACVPVGRSAGRGVEGGGDRVAARPRAVSGGAPQPARRVPPRLPQPVDGDALEQLRHRRRPPGHRIAGAAAAHAP